MKKIVIALAAISMAGCVSQKDTNQNPEIAALTVYNGKGVPNGRSDSREPHTKLKGISTDPTYGYTKENPIRVGVGDFTLGSVSEKFFLNSLLSESGQPVEFERVGSCCHFKTPNGFDGVGLLDVFTVKVPEKSEPITLYLNMYDPVTPIAPMGFTLRVD